MSSTTIKVALEHHFLNVEGKIYTDIAFAYSYWREYLGVFNDVIVIARVGHAQTIPDGWIRADGDRVQFHEVYDYLGFWHFLLHLPRVFLDCRSAVAGPDPILMRNGNISLLCWLNILSRRKPYALEVVGHAGIEASGVKHVQFLRLGRLIGWAMHRCCKAQASGAACASYVSQYVRELYPTRSKRECVFTSVKLPDSAFRDPREKVCFDHIPIRVISVGRVEPGKGHHILIRAAAEMKRRKSENILVEIVGPGSQIGVLRRLAKDLGVADSVRLLGRVEPGSQLEQLLDQADLFVLPSLTEGMPRALLEAMARGVPAIGSRAGGIVELLSDDCLVEPGDPVGLAKAIMTMIRSPERLAALSRRGYEKAHEYHLVIMNERKLEFWRYIRQTMNPSKAIYSIE